MIFPSSIKIIAEKIHQRIQLQNCAPIWNCNNHSWQNNQAEYQWLCCFPKTRFLLSKQGCFWSGICNSLFMHHLSNLIRGRWSICQKQFFHQVCQELASSTQTNSCKDSWVGSTVYRDIIWLSKMKSYSKFNCCEKWLHDSDISYALLKKGLFTMHLPYNTVLCKFFGHTLTGHKTHYLYPLSM